MINTDVLLIRVRSASTEVDGLKEVIKANTEALNQVKVELTTCNNAEKVSAVLADVEKVIQDLSLTSQKVAAALHRSVPQLQQQQQAQAVDLGQYPIVQPLNPDNPVPWPPAYNPPVPPADLIVSLNYQYYQQGNSNPPAGFCYQSASDTISFNYKDNDISNNMTLFQAMAVGDTISMHGIVWTIIAIPPQIPGSVFTYTVSPADYGSPYGLALFTFDHVASKAKAAKTSSDKPATGGKR